MTEINILKTVPQVICVDGINGCGKTTLVSALQDGLDTRGIDSVVIRMVDDPFRSLALGDSGLDDLQRMMIYRTAAMSTAKRVSEALAENKWVIMDRGYGSFFAYQGYVCGLLNKIVALERVLASPLPKVDYHIFLDLPVEDCEGRIASRHGDYDHFEIHADAYLAQKGFRNFYVGDVDTGAPAYNKAGVLTHIMDEMPIDMMAGLILDEITTALQTSFSNFTNT